MSEINRLPPLANCAPTHRLEVRSSNILAGILVLGTGLRFAWLGENSLWFDEAWGVWLASHPWSELLTLIRTVDAQPPLYYVLMKAWIAVAGTSETALRIPSACFSAVTVGLAYGLIRKVSSHAVSLLSAFLVAASPFAVMAGQDARMYALLGMLAVASTLALVVSVEKGGRLRWTAYVALVALMAYTHYFAAFILIAHGVWIAGWERRHLGTWLLSMGAAALFYAPWIPSLWDQTFHGNGWPWYRRDTFFVDTSDLLGLLSFEGSLFGVGSYFFPGTLGLAGQGLLLLPFLMIGVRGLVVLAHDPRRLALVTLPFGAVAGGVAVLAIARVVAYPRWFSFLVPFYAVCIAQGIVGIAGRSGRRRLMTATILTAGLLCFSVPVLLRYYRDPQFRPYPWRSAASLVKTQVRPGDFLLYVNFGAEVAFSYYFQEPHPSLVLFPVESGGGSDRSHAFSTATLKQLAERYPRVWLIATPPFTEEMQRRLVPALAGAFRVVGARNFPAIWVHLLEAKPSQSR